MFFLKKQIPQPTGKYSTYQGFIVKRKWNRKCGGKFQRSAAEQVQCIRDYADSCGVCVCMREIYNESETWPSDVLTLFFRKLLVT